MKPKVTLTPYDAAKYLTDDKIIARYLAEAATDATPGVFMLAVEAVAKARGMARVAEASGLTRESLYRALAPGAHPRFDTVRRVLNAFCTDFVIVPKTGATPEAMRATRATPNPTRVPVKRPARPVAVTSAPSRRVRTRHA